MTDKTKAAVTGGVVLGLLSAIPPISFGNLCCCMWVLGGGALASYLYIRRAPEAVTMGEGAQMGALAGVVGTVVALSIGIPIGLILGNSFNAFLVNMIAGIDARSGEEMRRQVEIAQAQPFIQKLPILLATSAFNTVIYIAFAALGGLLGVKLFEKRVNTVSNMMPPPPPSNFG